MSPATAPSWSSAQPACEFGRDAQIPPACPHGRPLDASQGLSRRVSTNCRLTRAPANPPLIYCNLWVQAAHRENWRLAENLWPADSENGKQHMGDVIYAGRRFPRGRLVSPVTHKFAVGASVICPTGQRSEKGLFQVVRHLPDGGQGLQYRLKSVADGHERTAFEAVLDIPPPADAAT